MSVIGSVGVVLGVQIVVAPHIVFYAFASVSTKIWRTFGLLEFVVPMSMAHQYRYVPLNLITLRVIPAMGTFESNFVY